MREQPQPLDAPKPLSRLRTLRGMRLWNLSGAFTAIHGSITVGAPATGFALSLGATTPMIGFLSAAPLLAGALQIFSPLLIERQQRRKRFCVGMFLTGYSMWLLIALIPWLLPAPVRAWAMILLVFVGASASAVAMPAANSWLTDLVPQDIRGRFIGRQQSIGSTSGLISGLLVGRFLDCFPEGHQEAGFMAVFTVAVLAAMAGMTAWMAVPEPPVTPSRERVNLRLLALPFRNDNFRNLGMFVAIRTGAVYLASPFFVVYLLNDLQIPYTQIALYTGTATVFSVLANPFWGYLADKFGYKPILRISSFGIALNPLMWFCATRANYVWVLPLAQGVGGFMASGLILSQFNLMLKIAPKENRSVYIGWYNAVANLTAAVGSVLSGILARWCESLGPLELLGAPISHLQVVFLVSAFWRMLGLSYLRKVHEDAEISARALMRKVRSGNPFLTIWNLFRLQRSTAPSDKVRAARGLASAGSELAVDELIAALQDSDREVRREAVRGLGVLGDERAVWPLINIVLDPATDLVEDAVEALGKIASKRSLPAMIELLADSRPTVRKNVALTLGLIGDREALEPLEELLEVERDPAVFLAACEALSRIGGRRALHRLRPMLHRASAEVPRRQLANSIGNLLGEAGEFYRLLEAEPMRQETMVAAVLRRQGRRLARARAIDLELRGELETNLALALADYEQQDRRSCVYHLRLAASLAVRSFVEQHPTPAAGGSTARRVGDLIERNPRLRLNFGFLGGLVRDSKTPLHPEEALLGVFAFQQVAEELVALAQDLAPGKG